MTAIADAPARPARDAGATNALDGGAETAADAGARPAVDARGQRAARPSRAVGYGIRVGSVDEPFGDPRARCPPAWRELLPEGPIEAIYFGSEFCEDRLPGVAEAKALCARARERACTPTLLTPIVTPRGLCAVDTLLAALTEDGHAPAVVFSDWGVLGLLRERHPGLARRAGRLVNRSLRDPRAYRDAPAGRATHDTARFARVHRMLASLGVEALETDVDLDGGWLGDGAAFARALHVPYTFAASGRACPLKAGLHGEAGGFAKALAEPCPAPCRGKPLAVRRADTSLPHFRAGNTLFYEVPGDAVRTWLGRAERIVVHAAPVA